MPSSQSPRGREKSLEEFLRPEWLMKDGVTVRCPVEVRMTSSKPQWTQDELMRLREYAELMEVGGVDLGMLSVESDVESHVNQGRPRSDLSYRSKKAC